MVQIFEHLSYLKVLHEFLAENSGVRGYKASMSRAMGCQASYLSQVLVAKVNITPEQALALTEFWELRELETEYFLKLVDYERSGTERLRRRLREQIEDIRQETKRLRSHHDDDTKPLVKVRPEDAIFYWANWECPAIYEYLKMEGKRLASQIASRFLIPVEHVQILLGRLKTMGLVRADGDLWSADGNIELAVDELGLIQAFHRSIRERANYRLITPGTNLVTFTSLGSVSRADIPKISSFLREMADRTAKMQVESTEKDELVSLCVDFFIV